MLFRSGNDGQMLMRRTLCLLSPVLGMGLVLSACSSSQQATSPRSACSLLSAKEASAAFGGPVSKCQPAPGGIGDQSDGLYLSGGTKPGTLVIYLSWDTVAVNSFTMSHSGHAHYAPGIAPPVYSRVTVSGIFAYWQLSPSSVTNNKRTPTAYMKISALKKGYVVTLNSLSLSQSQDESALASIIRRL